MRVAFASFKEIIVIAGLAYVIASVLAVAMTPVGARGEQAVSVSVDRANKGDRLPYASTSKTHVNSPFLATTPQVLPKQPSLGCDRLSARLLTRRRLAFIGAAWLERQPQCQDIIARS